MPHLQFEINKCVNNVTKQKFVIFIEKSFSRIMQTGTDHIAISVREYEKENLSLGRANKSDHVCLMNLDIRIGRSKEQKIELIKTFVTGVEKFFNIKKVNQYVTLTNHPGNEFNFYEKSLQNWVKDDDPNNQF